MEIKMFNKILLTLITLTWASLATAVPVTVNMTGDNIISSGGLCDDSNCLDGIGWSELGPIPNFENWTQSDSITFDLRPGTYYFAFLVFDSGGPEGLLAEFLWDDQINRSSAAWEVFDDVTGATIESAIELAANDSAPIWGTIAGISNEAQWIWSSNQSPGQDSVWIRTNITIDSVVVSAPATLGLLLSAFVVLFARKKLISK